MKLVIAGCRDWEPSMEEMGLAVEELVGNRGWMVEVVHGDCLTGVDKVADGWARKNGYKITKFPPNWDAHGRAAGPIRNRQMAQYGDVLLAFWDGVSRGTRSMIEEMRRANKEVCVKMKGG